MSLNYKFTGRTDAELETLWTKENVGTTDTIIRLTMIVGVPALLTDDDITRYAVRISAYEGCMGAFLREMRDDHQIYDLPITRAMLLAYKGLSTNATKYTDAQFRKNLIERVMNDAERTVQSEIKAAKEGK